jgi:hypothetical protein
MAEIRLRMIPGLVVDDKDSGRFPCWGQTSYLGRILSGKKKIFINNYRSIDEK